MWFIRPCCFVILPSNVLEDFIKSSNLVIVFHIWSISVDIAEENTIGRILLDLYGS